jgi:uncharacterized delta-60 repeat protein
MRDEPAVKRSANKSILLEPSMSGSKTIRQHIRTTSNKLSLTNGFMCFSITLLKCAYAFLNQGSTFDFYSHATRCPVVDSSYLARLRVRVAALALSALASGLAISGPGDPDTTFQISGRVHTVINGLITYHTFSTGEAAGQPAIALQPDGKIVIVGSCKIGATWDLCVLRYGAGGAIDTTFGVSGAVTTDMQGADDFAAGIAIQPDGKIVVAATCENTLTITTRRDFCVARYTATGALDTTFSGTGIVRTSFSNFDDVATSMALQSDGKIVVAGYCANNAGAFNSSSTFGIEICVARYTNTGELDTGFSGDGTLRTSIGGTSASFVRNKANAVAIASDGKIVLTGSRYVGTASGFSDTDLLLVRLLPDGELDTSFSSDGVVTRAWTSWIYGSALTIQPDGRILIAGYRIGGCGALTECMIALRYNESGSPDATFGASGVVAIDVSAVGTAAYTHAIALQNDGKIVLAGNCGGAGVSRKFCFARLHGDGDLDNSFATNGIGSLAWRADGRDYGSAVAITRSGSIVLGGFCYPVNDSEVAFCIARREGGAFGARNCSLDIDGDGRTTATIDGLIATRVMLGLTGSAVIGGISFPANASRDEWGTNTSRDIRKYLITQCGLNLS